MGYRGGLVNPEWIEWLMGYPSRHTELLPSAMQWYRQQRGKRSAD
jgi:hypothetical protein